MVNRKLIFLALMASSILIGCGGTSVGPINPTANEDEYLLNVQDDHYVASDLNRAKEAAYQAANDKCANESKEAEILEEIDSPMTLMRRPETTIRFRCVNPGFQ